jgi:glycosyltransferase involved in cell wall biosynthesis
MSSDARMTGRRILFLLPSLEMGGAERQALLLARHLSAQDAVVSVWGFGPPGAAAARCEELGLATRALALPPAGDRLRQVLSFAALGWQLRRARAEVLLPYGMMPNVLAGLLWRAAGARLSLWNQRDEGITRTSPSLERRAVRQTPLFVANSRGGAAFLTETLGAEPGRVHLVPNGIELAPPQADRARWRARLGLSEDAFAACMVANLTRHKDHATLLRAWSRALPALRQAGLNPCLLLAGREGDTAPAVRTQAAELGIADAVRFLGHVGDVPGLLHSVDLGLLSSRSEGSPNGVLEAMAAGLPVAGTDVDGIRDALGPDASPYLAAPADAEALAARLVELGLSPERRAAAGRANADRVRREFSPEAMCRRMEGLILEGLGGARPGGR